MAKQGTITNWDAMLEQIIFYRLHLDIFILEAFPPIHLTRDQHVIARSFGNASDIKIVQSRGSGKTWLIALLCFAVCCLYPGTIVIVCSGTASQATLVLQKLKLMCLQNRAMANELTMLSARSIVQLASDKGKCTFKNGSYIESHSVLSMRGLRGKIVVIDETPLVDQQQLDAIVSPVKNYRREISFNYGFKDYPSKTVAITSACEKSNEFYNEFVRVVKGMAAGDKECFACALDYQAAAANGITDMLFFLQLRAKMPETVFQMLYGSKFIGATTNSAFPYELVQSCRTLHTVLMLQPKNSKSRYVISIDIATSESKKADNAIISVVKFVEKSNGLFYKKLVNMRSFHGKSLDLLAELIRKMYHRKFPHTEMIVYDARGLGDSFSKFMDKEWVDVQTGKEYPPLITVEDDPNAAAQQKLFPFRAVQALNQRIYTNLRVALEQRTIELPINARIIQNEQSEITDASKRMQMLEIAVYMLTDALTFEMGTIVGKVGSSGNILYDVPRQGMHKDRYSSLAMAVDYIAELLKVNIKKNRRSTACIGLVDAL